MKDNVRTWLVDMLMAIEEMDHFIEDGATFDDFSSDIKTKRAVERNIEIIGEAANRIIKEEPEIDIDHIHQIIGTRNRIVHGYDAVSYEILWSIMQTYLPDLKEQLTKLLQEE